MTHTKQLGREVEAGGALIEASSESGGEVAPVSRRRGNHSIFVKPVSARWALLSVKADCKISSFHPKIPSFDPGTFGVGSKRASNELPRNSVQHMIKTQPE